MQPPRRGHSCAVQSELRLAGGLWLSGVRGRCRLLEPYENRRCVLAKCSLEKFRTGGSLIQESPKNFKDFAIVSVNFLDFATVSVNFQASLSWFLWRFFCVAWSLQGFGWGALESYRWEKKPRHLDELPFEAKLLLAVLFKSPSGWGVNKNGVSNFLRSIGHFFCVRSNCWGLVTSENKCVWGPKPCIMRSFGLKTSTKTSAGNIPESLSNLSVRDNCRLLQRLLNNAKLLLAVLLFSRTYFPQSTVTGTILKFGWIHLTTITVTVLASAVTPSFLRIPDYHLESNLNEFSRVTITVTVLKCFRFRKAVMSNMTVNE